MYTLKSGSVKDQVITIMNFSHIYEEERFYRHQKIRWIDCSGIRGTDGYCDSEAACKIREQIADYPPEGIHFIDSGNHHYVSFFWTEKITEPFCLIVFDHHSDMQAPMFSDFLSCGSWILEAIENNVNLKKVVLVGLSRAQEEKIDERYRSKVNCIDDERLHTNPEMFSQLCGDIPVYISIDKDVLSKSVVDTSWDQGSMNLYELRRMLRCILNADKVIGMDVCGECPDCIEYLKSIDENDKVSSLLIDILEA